MNTEIVFQYIPLAGKPPPHITQEMNAVGKVFVHYKSTNSKEWDAYTDLVNVFKAYMPGIALFLFAFYAMITRELPYVLLFAAAMSY